MPLAALQGKPQCRNRHPPAPHSRTAPTMRWLKTEYILKGVYLGLVLFAALQAAASPRWNARGAVVGTAAFSQRPPTPHADGWYALLWVNLAGLVGLLIAM